MKHQDKASPKGRFFPLFSGELSCGLFGISDDFVESYLSLDEKYKKNKESIFFVRSGGDSMSPEIKNEDILIVDRSIEPFHQAIVAIFYNGLPMCKQLLIDRNKQVLRSFHEDYKDIVIYETDEINLFGVVVGLSRDFY